jgi:predicted TIM-barrel fold metal-dependent hydrolase
MIIDSHAHIFRHGMRWAEGRRYTPDYDAALELYLHQLDENGIDRGVLVQPSFLGTDNAYVTEGIAAAGGRLRGVAVVDPAVSPDELARLDRAGIVGMRLNLLGRPLPDFAQEPWPALLAEVARLGWQVEIQRAAADLADLVPRLLDVDLSIVLDHFALPSSDLGIEDPGFQRLLTLGGSRRIWVKLSAPYRSGPKGEAIGLAAYPLLRQAFGLDRLLWGSDWPHTQFETVESYPKNRAFLDRLVPEAAERAAILVSGAQLFRFA